MNYATLPFFLPSFTVFPSYGLQPFPSLAINLQFTADFLKAKKASVSQRKVLNSNCLTLNNSYNSVSCNSMIYTFKMPQTWRKCSSQALGYICYSIFQFVTQHKIWTRKGGSSTNLHLSRKFGTAASRIGNHLPKESLEDEVIHQQQSFKPIDTSRFMRWEWAGQNTVKFNLML